MNDWHTAPHDFGPAPDRIGTVGWCLIGGCHGFAVATAKGWRDPTADERVSVTCAMWDDVIYAQALQLVHGKEQGLAKYRYLTGRRSSDG